MGRATWTAGSPGCALARSSLSPDITRTLQEAGGALPIGSAMPAAGRLRESLAAATRSNEETWPSAPVVALFAAATVPAAALLMREPRAAAPSRAGIATVLQ
ncbi:hypothetical protein [Streptomyces sp. NPDC101234]|uniref:hypothetical protein n=1 Tax=Streptomyces sp. NPDC101234 TaxID=3366138 RepID=UPI00380FA76A